MCCAAGVTFAADVPTVPTNSTGEWVKLFADEQWYKQQAAHEQVFRGNLTAIQTSQASTLMRNAFYKLGDRTIYTGATKLSALDALTERKVDIRGKSVDTDLEGQSIREIWPAAVRVVEGAGAASNGSPPGGAAPDRATAEKLARDFLVGSQVQVATLKAFRMPHPVEAWWMVEYSETARPAVGPGLVVYVNQETGKVTRQAPQGMPPRL